MASSGWIRDSCPHDHQDRVWRRVMENFSLVNFVKNSISLASCHDCFLKFYVYLTYWFKHELVLSLQFLGQAQELYLKVYSLYRSNNQLDSLSCEFVATIEEFCLQFPNISIDKWALYDFHDYMIDVWQRCH